MRLDTTGIDPIEHALARRCSVGDILTRSAATFGSRTAVTDLAGEWTYAELESQANRLAHGLVESGIQAEDAVAILSPNCREFLAAYFGAAKMGGVALPVNLLLGPETILHTLTDSRAPALIVHASLLELVLGALPAAPDVRVVVVIGKEAVSGHNNGDVRILGWNEALSSIDSNPDTVIGDRQIAQCLYSSGTTSLPKGVLTSHLAVTVASLSNAATGNIAWGAEPSIATMVLPLFHTAGLNGVALPSIVMGSIIHLLPGFEPEQLARTIEATKTTHFVGLPVMMEALAEQSEKGVDLSSVTRLMYAMAPMSQTMFARVQAAMPNADIILASGMTECTPATVQQWPELNPEKTNSWGYPTASTLNRISEPNSAELLPRGKEGEIVYRGPTVMEGYFTRPDANAEAFTGGYMHSGDLGHIDDEGVVWFSDRVKDIVKSGGENVSSMMVERTMMDHPDIAEVAIIGRPDEKWGERVVAIVVPKNPDTDLGALRQSIVDFGASHLSNAARPREVVIVEEIPRTATGKIRKAQLRKTHNG